jgi:hypothetical protein
VSAGNVRNRTGVLDDARGLNPDETVIKVTREYRLFFLKPVKRRAAGLAKMRELPFNSKESNQRPGMWVSNLCEGWWETVPVIPSDPHRPDIPDTAANDHFYDASAYAATHEPRVMRVRPLIGTN